MARPNQSDGKLTEVIHKAIKTWKAEKYISGQLNSNWWLKIIFVKSVGFTAVTKIPDNPKILLDENARESQIGENSNAIGKIMRWRDSSSQ